MARCGFALKAMLVVRIQRLATDSECAQVLSCSASTPTLLHAATKNTICQLTSDCSVPGQVCLTPPAQTVEYTGLGIKVCRCRQDFMAGVNCSTVCDGGLGNACSGHGECLYGAYKPAQGNALEAGTCACQDGWFGLPGSQCSATCPRGVSNLICSGRGDCTPTGPGRAYCMCKPGYRGAVCETECQGGHANPCSGHGTCQADGSCTCQASWKTADCSIGCPGQTGYAGSVACFGQGTCTDAGFCECDPVWRGLSCQLECPLLAGVPCAGNGICNDEAKCVCNKGFRGTSCQIECLGGFQMPCNGNGVCQADGSCKCSQGWVGASCNILCPGGEEAACSLRGTCFAQGEYGKCRCNENPDTLVPKYVGENCEIAVYSDKKRDANETKTETKAIVFSPPSLWPAFVPPLVVLGAAVALLVLRLVFGWIDKRIALARAHQEAIRLASQGQSGKGKLQGLRRTGSTRQMREFTRSRPQEIEWWKGGNEEE